MYIHLMLLYINFIFVLQCYFEQKIKQFCYLTQFIFNY